MKHLGTLKLLAKRIKPSTPEVIESWAFHIGNRYCGTIRVVALGDTTESTPLSFFAESFEWGLSAFLSEHASEMTAVLQGKATNVELMDHVGEINEECDIHVEAKLYEGKVNEFCHSHPSTRMLCADYGPESYVRMLLVDLDGKVRNAVVEWGEILQPPSAQESGERRFCSSCYQEALHTLIMDRYQKVV